MRYLLLPFFVLSLILKNLTILIELVLLRLLPYRALLLTLFLVIIVSFFTWKSIWLDAKKQKQAVKTQLYIQQNALEAALKKQPTDRDIILNLSKVYQALGKNDQAKQFYQQAQRLDPNFYLFK